MNRSATAWSGAIALGALMVCAGGCTPKIKAIEGPGQTVLRKGRAALIEREGLAAILTPARVRLQDDDLIVAMRIELINQSNRPVKLDWRAVRLIGGDGLKRPATDPRQFKRYAEFAQGDPPPPYARRYPVVAVGVGYGGWHHYPYAYPYRYYGPPYYYEPYDPVEEYYRRRERIARFVASLWRTETVKPGYVGTGYVVFEYELRKKDRFSVELRLDRLPTTQPAATSTRAAPAPSSQPLQPTEPGPLSLRFYFKT